MLKNTSILKAPEMRTTTVSKIEYSPAREPPRRPPEDGPDVSTLLARIPARTGILSAQTAGICGPAPLKCPAVKTDTTTLKEQGKALANITLLTNIDNGSRNARNL